MHVSKRVLHQAGAQASNAAYRQSISYVFIAFFNIIFFNITCDGCLQAVVGALGTRLWSVLDLPEALMRLWLLHWLGSMPAASLSL